MGYPVELHLGVRKQGEELISHSWVTLSLENLSLKKPF
jgi:hypothetical protein